MPIVGAAERGKASWTFFAGGADEGDFVWRFIQGGGRIAARDCRFGIPCALRDFSMARRPLCEADGDGVLSERDLERRRRSRDGCSDRPGAKGMRLMRVRSGVTIVGIAVGLVFLGACDKKQDAAPPSSGSRQAAGGAKEAADLPEVDWQKVLNELEQWHQTAESNALSVKGLHEQAFLVSKSRIVAADDGEKVRFAGVPNEEPRGAIFLMPQNAWFLTIEQAVESMESLYKERKAYERKEFSVTSYEQIAAAESP
jgi:hypothetical protein